MEIKCNYCKKEWNYKGIAEYYATCPSCRYKVHINWTAEQLEVLKKIKELEER